MDNQQEARTEKNGKGNKMETLFFLKDFVDDLFYLKDAKGTLIGRFRMKHEMENFCKSLDYQLRELTK